MIPRQHNKREKPEKQTQGESPPKQKSRVDLPGDGADKKEPVGNLTQLLKFDPGVGNDDKQFSLLYMPEEENARTFLFISGKNFARDIKKNPSVTLEGFDDKAVAIKTVIDLTKVSPASAGLHGRAGDASSSITGMLAAAYEINQAILQSRVEDDATGVLVHCMSGYERSVSSTLFYLMGYQGYSFEDAARTLFDALESGRVKKEVEQHNPDHGNNHHQTIKALFEGAENLNQEKKVLSAIETAASLTVRETALEKNISVTIVIPPKLTPALKTLMANLKSGVSAVSRSARRSTRSRTASLAAAAQSGRDKYYKQEEVKKKSKAEKKVETKAKPLFDGSTSVSTPRS